MRQSLILFLVAAVLSASADVVHVYEQTLVGGVTTGISDRLLDTGRSHFTQNAPKVNGYIFTHWMISTKQPFSPRDAWGRALDTASFALYEKTTLTANYLPESQDDDGDGIADGYEMYWYGNFDQTSLSDTDGDGVSFAEELATGTNPLMAEYREEGPISFVDSNLLQYNPYNYQPYTIRSEPDGALFATIVGYKRAGEELKTDVLKGTTFAYWRLNGVRQSDAWGRALDVVSLRMSDTAVEIVAVCEEDYETRMKLYWYGNTSVAMTSDMDGDGRTFAEELAAGTNPLMAEHHEEGPVLYVDGVLMQYNPYNLQPYIVRSEPEGALFATTSDYVRAGMSVSSKCPGGSFAYWVLDGVPQRDAWGRAVDDMSFRMPEKAVELVAVIEEDENVRQKLYWYGNTTISMESDTDGDGRTFAEELAVGTNPLMAEWHEDGPIAFTDTLMLEMNLQSYEQVQGTIVGNEYLELFTSTVAGNGSTSRTFDGAAKPTMVDLNGDSLSDLVVETDKGAITVFLNKGAAGNPMFIETPWREEWRSLLTAAKSPSIEGLTFDVEPVGIISWTFADIDSDGDDDILMADNEGRIWYYKASADGYLLQHKVWGGSYTGFAEGLSIFATDWDDDGDMDLLCGTAGGKLMLLNDPRVGRPVNVRAEAGVDSVVLSWDPNVNSRVRGYGVYRSSDSNEFAKVQNMWPLPRYRDTPDVIQDYWYRVTGKSRLYVAGNSTPIESESMPTDAVYVQFRPSVWLNDTSSFTETNVEVVVSMNNSMGISADGLSMTFTYDPAVLDPVEMKACGLTADMTLTSSGGNGTWTMRATGGEIKTGSGIFMKLVFYVKGVHDVTKTIVTFNAATVKALDGHEVTLELPKSATIEIADSHPLVPAVVAVDVADAAVESETEFVLPVTVTSSETLTNFVAEVGYDEARLRFDGWRGTIGGDNLALAFYAIDPNSTITNFATTVSVTNIVAIDCNGFSVTAADAVGTVLIKNTHPIVPAVVSVSTEDKKVDTLTEFTLPVTITSNEKLKSGAFTVTYDPTVLEWRGESSAFVEAGKLSLSATENFALKFYAKDQHDVTQTAVTITDATVVDIHDFTVKPFVPVVATVLIHDANPLLPPKVSMTLQDVAVKTETEFAMTLSISTTEALKALGMDIQYDTGLLELKSGVLSYSDGVPNAVVLTFYAKENHTVTKTAVTILPKSGVGENGLAAELPSEVVGNVILADSNPWKPAEVSVGIVGAKVDTLTEFELPVTVTSNEELKSGAFTIEYDPAVLEWHGEALALVRAGVLNIFATEIFALKFYAKDQHDVTQTSVRITEATVTDIHDFVVKPSVPVVATVLIHDANPLLPPKVTMSLSDVSVKTEQEFEMVLSIATTEALKALGMDIQYDTGLLELKSGVLSYSDGVPNAVVLTFYAKENHTVTKTAVTILPKSGVGENGLAAELPSEVVGNVILADSNPWKPAEVSVGIVGAKVDTLTEFELPVTVTSNEELESGAFTVEYDPAVLEWCGEASALVRAGVLNIFATESFALKFYAKDQHDVTQTAIKVTDATVVDIHDFTVKPIVPVVGTVLIHDSKPLVPAGVILNIADAHIETCRDFTVPITVTTTKTLKELSVKVAYDANLFEYKSCAGGVWNNGTITATGTVPRTILLTFYAKDQHTVTQSKIKLSAASAKCTDNLQATVTTTDGIVYITDSNVPVPVSMTVATWHAKVKSGEIFQMPIGATTSGGLAELVATVEWDSALLTFVEAASATKAERLAANKYRFTFSCAGEYNTLNLTFKAGEITGLQSEANVTLLAATGTGENGLAAKLETALPYTSKIMIVREIGKFSSGDVDGDGCYTDNDLLILNGYVVYRKMLGYGSVVADNYAKSYQSQYHVNVKLSGQAVKAADVNCDGAVDSSDIAMLQMLIREAEGVGQ